MKRTSISFLLTSVTIGVLCLGFASLNMSVIVQGVITPAYTKTATFEYGVSGAAWFPAIDDQGNLYVPDSVADIIRVFSPNLTPLQNLTGFDNPHGVAFYNGRMYVGSQSNLSVFENGVLINSTTTSDPRDIEIDSQGHILVSSFSGDSVTVYTEDLTVVATLDVVGAEGVAVTADGYIYVASLFNDNMSIFNPSYAFAGTLGGLNDPYDIEIDVQGYVYVGETSAQRVEIFSPDLQPVTLLVGFGFPLGLVTNGIGDLYVVDQGNDNITRWTTTDLGDFEGPTIANVQINPLNPLASQPINVTATVTDISGLHNVTLTYTVPGAAPVNLTMTSSGSTYTAVIPGLPATSNAFFTITAEDNSLAHHIAISPAYHFNVLASGTFLGIDTSLIAVGGLGLGGVALLIALLGLRGGGKKGKR